MIFLGVCGITRCVDYTAAVYQWTAVEFRAHQNRNPKTAAGFSL